MSRVFRCQVLREYFVTAGEDSIVNIWSFDGKLLRKIETHQGSPVWSLECKEKDNLLITGGGDCGVTVFPVEINCSYENLKLPSNEIPKSIGILESGNFVALSDTGTLYCFSLLHRNWLKIQQHDDLKNYGLLEVSKCRKLISLAGLYYKICIRDRVKFSNTVGPPYPRVIDSRACRRYPKPQIAAKHPYYCLYKMR